MLESLADRNLFKKINYPSVLYLNTYMQQIIKAPDDVFDLMIFKETQMHGSLMLNRNNINLIH